MITLITQCLIISALIIFGVAFTRVPFQIN